MYVLIRNKNISEVALRKESVDRNTQCKATNGNLLTSLSARRAWIEIAQSWRISGRALSLSARRAWIEIILDYFSAVMRQSLSARRAWIEMICYNFVGLSCFVALRKESVDRNCPTCQWRRSVKCRSPQGERG